VVMGMKQQGKSVEVLAGIAALFLCHVPLALAAYFFFWIPPMFGSVVALAMGLVGITQLIYVLPLRRVFRQRKRPYAARGVVVGAVITVVLNVAVWFYLFYVIGSFDR